MSTDASRATNSSLMVITHWAWGVQAAPACHILPCGPPKVFMCSREPPMRRGTLPNHHPSNNCNTDAFFFTSAVYIWMPYLSTAWGCISVIHFIYELERLILFFHVSRSRVVGPLAEGDRNTTCFVHRGAARSTSIIFTRLRCWGILSLPAGPYTRRSHNILCV